MRPLIPFCDVTIHGAAWAEEEALTRCRVLISGTPANAVLFSAERGENAHKPVDRLTDAVVREVEDGFVIEGISDELVFIVGVAPEDAAVRWDVKTTECLECG